jgi:hypothetical protein
VLTGATEIERNGSKLHAARVLMKPLRLPDLLDALPAA